MNWLVADHTKAELGTWDSFVMTSWEVLKVEKVGDTMLLRPPTATRYYLFEVIEFNGTNKEARFEVRPAWEHEIT